MYLKVSMDGLPIVYDQRDDFNKNYTVLVAGQLLRHESGRHVLLCQLTAHSCTKFSSQNKSPSFLLLEISCGRIWYTDGLTRDIAVVRTLKRWLQQGLHIARLVAGQLLSQIRPSYIHTIKFLSFPLLEISCWRT